MWKTGTFMIGDITYSYEAKVFEEKSRFGIHNGRISKLTIWRGGIHDFTTIHEAVTHYDRGWDIVPCNEPDRRALNHIILLYSY